MKRITAADLAGKTSLELSALYARVRAELEQTPPGTYEHELLATSLDNIRRAFVARQAKGPGL